MKNTLLFLSIAAIFLSAAVPIFASGISEADSLKQALKSSSGTAEVEILNALARNLKSKEPGQSFKYAQMALEKAEDIGYLVGKASALHYIGSYFLNKSEHDKALKYYLGSLKVEEEIGDKSRIGNTLHNIAVVMETQMMFDQALKYYERALQIYESTNDSIYIAATVANMGNIYFSSQNYAEALNFYTRAYELMKSLNQQEWQAYVLSNIGSVYREEKNYEEALEYFYKALRLEEEGNNLYSVAESYMNIGAIYYEMKDYFTAEYYTKKGLQIAEKIEAKSQMVFGYSTLAVVQEKLNAPYKAIESWKRIVALKDSIFKVESSEKIAELEAIYETEKKEQQIQLQQEQLEKEEVFRYSIGSGAFMLFLLATALFNRFRISKKKNKIIEYQKKLVEEKNRNIVDSITYAERIQQAILPAPEYIQSHFQNHFIINIPKDIISGDFYWLHCNEEQNKIVWAVVDCTGHGVPGSLMSMIGNTLLNEIVIGRKILQAGQILNLLREEIINSLRQKGNEGESRDGMDMALCVLDKSNLQLQYAGAYNPLYLIRDGGLKEVKGDKQPVGFYMGEEKPFARHTLQLQENDQIYLFSDGYADQFGGPRGKKFGYKKFKSIILETHVKPVQEQKQVLSDTFEEWKGKEEQIDDVLIMGVKI